MRTTESIVAIHRKRGQEGKPLERVYRHLFNPDLYLQAYEKISRNAGAMTKGVTEETVDGMALSKIQRIIEAVQAETYRWTPVRRVEIPKARGGSRPLGIPTWSDKLLQEVMRLLLEAYHEPKFRSCSYGFRPQRGCLDAVQRIKRSWNGTVWFIEGDIAKCFDTIDHDTLLSILARDINDGRFLRLVKGLLKAGYMQDLQPGKTLSGTPQGGIISPLLANIYLHELDKFVEDTLAPQYTRGKERQTRPEYIRAQGKVAYARRRGDWQQAKELALERSKLQRKVSDDPNFRRLRYIRYADDFLIGFAGPKAEAREIVEKLRTFLTNDLKLTLSPEKTLVTNATTDKAHFLGYEFTKLVKEGRNRKGNGAISVLVPRTIVAKVKERYARKGGKPTPMLAWLGASDYAIISAYQAVLRGVYGYYALGVNVGKRMSTVKFILEVSLSKTLAQRHKISVQQVFRRYGGINAEGYKVLRAYLPREGKDPLVATFGGIPLRHQTKASGTDLHLDQETYHHITRRSERSQRMLADRCELCSGPGPLQMHHIRHMSDLVKGKQARWKGTMMALQRKTLAVCQSCHTDIHTGKYDGQRLNSLLESRMQ